MVSGFSRRLWYAEMRILQLIDSLRIGGAQKLLVTFANQARENQLDLVVVSLSEFSNGMALASEIEGLGIRTYVFPAQKMLSIPRLVRLIRFVKQENFTVIHTHLKYANILGGLVGILIGIPVVSTLHSTSDDPRYAHAIRDQLEMWSLRRANLLLGVGENVARIFSEKLNRDVRVLVNAVDEGVVLGEDERNRLRKEITGRSDDSLLISVGRLSPDKCVDDLLKAFAHVRLSFPAASLLIVGDGEHKVELELYAQKLGVSDSVYWLGARNDIPQLLSLSDIFVSASRREGLSLAVLEAMNASLPLVVTDVGENRKLVMDDAGILVPSEDPARLAEAITELLLNREMALEMGAAGLARAREQFSAKKWFLQLRQVYETVELIKREKIYARV